MWLIPLVESPVSVETQLQKLGWIECGSGYQKPLENGWMLVLWKPYMDALYEVYALQKVRESKGWPQSGQRESTPSIEVGISDLKNLDVLIDRLNHAEVCIVYAGRSIFGGSSSKINIMRDFK